jgi:sulfur carrier protein
MNEEYNPATLHVSVNGELRPMPSGSNLEDLLTEVLVNPDFTGVAVALNDEVVRQSEWHRTALHDGDRIELVTATQGG